MILSQGRGQAGARAVDARRRFAVVHAVAGRILRCSDRPSMTTARSPRIRSITTCRPCRTIVSSAPCSPGCRRMPAPDVQSETASRSTVERHLRSVGLRPVPNVDGARPRHVPGRTEGVAARRRSPRSQHAHAGTVSAELSRASWPSAKRPRSPAWMPSSFASTTPTKSAPIGVLKAVRDASGWQTRARRRAPMPYPLDQRPCAAGEFR